MIYNVNNSNLKSCCNIAATVSRFVFILSVCMSYHICPDIVKLEDHDIQSTEIKAIIQNGTLDLSPFRSFVQGGQFKGIVKRFFVDQGDSYEHFWQMPGCCLFQYDKDLKLLISQKRNVKYDKTAVADNDSGVNREANKLFNYSTNMHTERQLVLGGLHIIGDGTMKQEDNPDNVGITEGRLIDKALCIAKNEQEILKDCDKCVIKQIISKSHNEKSDNNQQDTSRVMHIYTSANPCQNVSKKSYNGGISCVSYYNELAKLFPGIQFNIYFDEKEMQLNPNFIQDNKQETTLLHFIRDKLFTGKNETKTFPDIEGFTYTFVLDSDNKLKLELGDNNGNSDNFEMSVNEFTGNNDSRSNIRKLIAIINKILAANNKEQSQINNKQKQLLFNSIHNPDNIPNIHYYPI